MNRGSSLTRRKVLRAAGVSVTLPWLPSLHWKAFAADAAKAPPKRMVFLSFGWGVTTETWFPDKNATGGDYTLPEGLAPLTRHKQRISVIQGLSHKSVNDAHFGSTFWLTGANRYSVPGSSFSNSISVDQVAAEALGTETRFASLQFTSKDADSSGHGPGLSLAWNRRGKPMAGIDTPLAVYEKLFGDEKKPPDKLQQMLRSQRSALDAVLDQASALEKTLSARDQDKLDEYFQSIREIETRLAKDESWIGTPKPRSPIAAPADGLLGEPEVLLMYDLIVAAFQTDMTRVITYRQPMANLLKGMDISIAPHDLSHYSPGEKMEASQKRDLKQSDMLAALLDKLEEVKEADGTSLLDHVSLAFGSNIRTHHYLDNCPTLLAGGGAGVKQGRHIVLEAKQTPLCNLWLSLLQGVGIETDSFGDSTGTLSELAT